MSEPRSFRIGELAKLTGTTPRTIRYYEEFGLLPAASREAGAHRIYGPEHLERLQELLRLKELLGVSLEELRELVTAQSARGALRREWDEGIEDPVRQRQVLEEALAHVDSQIGLVQGRRKDAEALERELSEKRRQIKARMREASAGKARR